MNHTQPLTLLVCALGGEGGGVLTEWLVETARHAGYAAQSTSIPGVAQRTGATTYYIEVFPVPLAQLGGRRPVFSLSPVPGALDAIVSSELLETARQIGNGMSAPQRTLVISSSARVFTTAERMEPGDGRADAQRLLDVVKAFSREHHVFDMNAVAREAGTVVSAVMLGAVAGSGLFPFPREAYEQVVRGGGKAAAPEKLGRMAAASLRGFAAAFDAVHAPRAQAAFVSGVLAADGSDAPPPPRALPAALAQRFPPAVHDMLALGHARVADYQDAAYAALYADRLAKVLEAERAADPSGAQGFAITRETARWLALWMAFDDIVRVAALKARASRAERVRAEVRAGEEDIVKVYDHFKPGSAEFAALLPPSLARRVTGWDRRRQARGREPWALPLQVGSHSIAGMGALRLLASLKWLRRRGSRFADEQALIERWLAAVERGTREGWALGRELALCGRLIKGYGSTNERGKHNLLHVIDELAVRSGLPAPARAEAIAAAREAALADEGGKALDAALVRHGAAPRPVQAQPIRWMKRPPPVKA
ncbi:indolepyruvate ferredoxin oxidoreductase beta subunit [Variovorax sp. TBS-050B]|uniref:indolepyruvate oxidoreductase subunit beta family protein n=1 Tax=Variovorax sp. TBS-050B TaxID=2940551 RepID=UPI002473634A|nr:indolepyruvate oxidoreductase subunit beta family protein [Variovorax sp. TBS-050B]MDH6593322.1 indolepyruvate ferredoxin oxidoreductase beta subunit [Variovorax sp. TBS-050B]